MANVADLSSAPTGSEDSSVDSTDPSRPESVKSGGPWAGLFPDLSTVDWYLDPRFQRYWKHYHQVMAWYKKHVETYEMLSSRLNTGSAVSDNRNSARFNPYANLHRSAPKMSSQVPGCSAWSVPGGQQKTAKEPGPKTRPFSSPKPHTFPGIGNSASSGTETMKSGVSHATERSGVSHASAASQQSGQDEFEMEITDEMVEFFKQSRKHKQQREEAKKQGDPDQREEEHVDIEKVTQKRPATTEAPSERPGLRRTREMRLLYGKGAAMIHGMETATQMTFDRNTDLHKPKLWPNMPLKIVFS